MRALTLILTAAFLAALPAPASAQNYWYGNTTVVPYVTPFAPPYPSVYTQTYVAPWGARGFYETGTYPTPWGFNAYQRYGAIQRPLIAGPYRSLYYDPWMSGYRVGPGYWVAPTYSYRYRFGF